VDVDGNGTADIVYAGDLLGNLWKFDISSPTRGNWKVAVGGSPLFKAVGPTGAAQPITSAPAVVPDAQRGGFIVAFGTGKNLVSGDQSDANLNSVYALYDHQPMHAATLPASTTGYIQLDNGSPINCLTGAGAARYGCLYMQNGGAMDTGAQHGTVTSNTTSTLTDQTFDGSDGSESGWYFDIPDVDNGNAAKVLLNPTVLSGNTLMLYSSNVASSSGGGAGPAAGAESCGATALNGALTTVNYFDLLTGNAPDNTFIVGGVTFDPENNPGNRFRIEGAQTYIQNGSDTLQGIEQDASVKSVAPIRAGQRAGWRISR
jgi:type IV pilus assembly protein PilY1